MQDDAGADLHAAIDNVDRTDGVYSIGRDDDTFPTGRGQGSLDQTGIAALRYDDDVRLAAQADNRRCLQGITRQGNAHDVTGASSEPVDDMALHVVGPTEPTIVAQRKGETLVEGL